MTEFHVRMDEGTRAPEGATSHGDAELLRLRCEVAHQNLVIHQKAVEAYDLRQQIDALRSRIGELERLHWPVVDFARYVDHAPGDAQELRMAMLDVVEAGLGDKPRVDARSYLRSVLTVGRHRARVMHGIVSLGPHRMLDSETMASAATYRAGLELQNVLGWLTSFGQIPVLEARRLVEKAVADFFDPLEPPIPAACSCEGCAECERSTNNPSQVCFATALPDGALCVGCELRATAKEPVGHEEHEQGRPVAPLTPPVTLAELEAEEAKVAAEEAATPAAHSEGCRCDRCVAFESQSRALWEQMQTFPAGTRVRWENVYERGRLVLVGSFGQVVDASRLNAVLVRCDGDSGKIRLLPARLLTVCSPEGQHGLESAGRPEPQAVSPERPAAESPEEPAHFLGDQTPTPAEGRVQPGDDLPAFEGSAPWSPQAWERRKRQLDAVFFQTPLTAPAEPELERITGVAMMTLDGLWSLPAPARHHHVIHAYTQSMRKRCKGTAGFTTSKGRFVTRDEALALATQAKQLIRTPTGTLTSEDLWTTPAPDGSLAEP